MTTLQPNAVTIGWVEIHAPKTRHLKNRIREHGSRWEVIRAKGSRLHIRSANKTFSDGDGTFSHDERWIDQVECKACPKP